MRGLAALLMAFLVSGAAHAGPSKQIRDTAVYCSNGLSCDLTLSAKGEAKPLYGVALSRKSGPDTPVILTVRATSPLAAGGSLAFAADGQTAITLKVSAFDYQSEANQYTAKDMGAGRALFAAIRNASSLIVSFEAESPGTAEFSLAGVAGAGVYLDEVQGRIDATDALARIGEKTTAPSPVRDITEFVDLPAALRPEFEAQDSACGFYDSKNFTRSAGFAVTLPEQVELYVLPCTDGGAYNQPYALYQISSGYLSEVSLPVMTEDGPSTTSGATNIDWDQATKTLTAFDKGRGLGDCGAYTIWKLRGMPGEASFALVESRVKDACDGAGEGGPETWPLMWPVQ